MTPLMFRQLAKTLALLAFFPVLAVEAQETATPDKTASTAAAPAPANPALLSGQVSAAATPVSGVPGAPVIGGVMGTQAKPPAPAAATTPAPRVDPITGAPISTLGHRASVATEVSPGQEVTIAGDGSVHQGLKVHGHWVIDIRNPDGTLAQHHEFENSLEASAQGSMVGLLSGYLVPGDWMIVLAPQSGNGACIATYQYCGLIHNAATYPAVAYCGQYYCSESTLNYTFNFGTDFQGPFSIVLSGSITANQTGTIGTVLTLLNTCANIAYSSTANPSSIETSSPATCVTQTALQPWFGPFTSANITPIAVTSGQQIQAIVTLTFS
jgi:hypothetical protein